MALLRNIPSVITDGSVGWRSGNEPRVLPGRCVGLRRGARSEGSTGASLNKAAGAHGPFLTTSTCTWPGNVMRAKTCKNDLLVQAVYLRSRHGVQRPAGGQCRWKQKQKGPSTLKDQHQPFCEYKGIAFPAWSLLSFCWLSFWGFANW